MTVEHAGPLRELGSARISLIR